MNVNPLWSICLLVRTILVILAGYMAKQNSKNIKLVSSIILYSIGIGFFIKAITGKKDEVQFSKVFWQDTRLVHSMFYILSGYYLWMGNYIICMILLSLDILFSILYRVTTNK